MKTITTTILATLLTFTFANAQVVATSTIACPPITKILSLGARDRAPETQVAELQKYLRSYYGLTDQNLVVTGIFGKITRGYVREFQRDNGLIVTGIIGRASRNAIFARCATPKPQQPVWVGGYYYGSGSASSSDTSGSSTNTDAPSTTGLNSSSSSSSPSATTATNSTTSTQSGSSAGTTTPAVTVTSPSTTTSPSSATSPSTSSSSTQSTTTVSTPASSTTTTTTAITTSTATTTSGTGSTPKLPAPTATGVDYSQQPYACQGKALCMDNIEIYGVVGHTYLNHFYPRFGKGPFTFKDLGPKVAGVRGGVPLGMAITPILGGSGLRVEGVTKEVLRYNDYVGVVNDQQWEATDADGNKFPFYISSTIHRPNQGDTGDIDLRVNGVVPNGIWRWGQADVMTGTSVNLTWNTPGASVCNGYIKGPYRPGNTNYRTVNLPTGGGTGSYQFPISPGENGTWNVYMDCPITQADSGGSAQAYFSFVALDPVVLSPRGTTINTKVGVTASGKFPTATGGSGYDQFNYSISAGAVPPGYTMRSDGYWTINVTTPGTYTATVRVKDTSLSSGPSAEETYTWNISPRTPATITISPGSAASTFSNSNLTPGNSQISASGGVGPYTYSYTGTLPPNYTFNSSGQFTWAKSSPGNYSITVTARDANGDTGTATYSWNITQ